MHLAEVHAPAGSTLSIPTQDQDGQSLLAGRRGDGPDAELAVCFIAAIAVTIVAAATGVAFAGVT
ncbi:hypothetical protein ACIQYZ_29555, partial [Rhodococcus erythropolis]